MKKRTELHWALFIIIIFVSSCHECEHKQTTNAIKEERLTNFSAIYLDMHGTTLDPNFLIRTATVDALALFRVCGGKVGIATGGSLEQIELYLPAIKPSLPLVLFNGAVVMDVKNKKILTSHYLPKETIQQVVRFAEKQPETVGIILQGLDFSIVDRADEALLTVLKDLHITVTSIDPGLKKLAEYDKVIKIIVETKKDSPTELDAKLNKHLKIQGGRSQVTSPYSIEVVKSDAAKEAAVFRILQDHSISPTETVFFGDSNNDTALLRQIGLGIAMENCTPASCKAATAVIGPNDTDAIGKFIARAILTQECKRNY